MMRSAGVLLVGPYPPPHGGVSVHVEGLRDRLEQSGIPVMVVNARPGAPPSDEYISVGGAFGLLWRVARCARRGWVVHVHINGHNTKSWLLALICAIGGIVAPRKMLTVHSGMVPDYLAGGRGWRAALARLACRAFDRIVCVSEEIRGALHDAGCAADHMIVVPAYLPRDSAPAALPDWLDGWLDERSPLLATTLAFEPEYRFDLLVEAVARLRREHPRLGCVVMGGGSGEREARGLVARRGLDDAVAMLGDVDHRLCLRVFSAVDLYVRCTDRDGDAISVREALALGTPVVASDVGGRPADAVLFPAGDVDAMVHTVTEILRRSPRAVVHPGGTRDTTSLLAGIYETDTLAGRNERYQVEADTMYESE